MTESVDQEVQAIKDVLKALSPLSEKARASVLEYVVKRLDLLALQAVQSTSQGSGRLAAATTSEQGAAATPPRITDFKEQKKPRSANEMAALIAYFLANLAPAEQRKTTINQKDVATYFKIAEFPLPQQVRVTLPNAKAAGYFDSAGDGEYRLNAVGHNLVVHTMPRGRSSVHGSRAHGRRSRRQQAARTRKRRSS